MFRASVFTLYPDFFPGPLGQSLSGDALQRGLWSLSANNIRDHGLGRHKAVDDTPAGGGVGGRNLSLPLLTTTHVKRIDKQRCLQDTAAIF